MRVVMVIAVLLGSLVAAGCSGPSEAEGLCSQLDAGVTPIQAIGTLPGADADPPGTAAKARDYIRSTCPQHEPAAASLDAILGAASSPPPAGGGMPPGDLQACMATGRAEPDCQQAYANGEGG